MEPIDLRCERLVDPIGVGTASPRLSWRLDGGGGSAASEDPDPTGVEQVAARVVVGLAGSDELVWDSGRLQDWRMLVRYGGPPLASRSRCWWKVHTWCTHDADPDTLHEAESAVAHFELGLLEPGDWRARMIRPAEEVPSAAVRFSRSFELPSAPTEDHRVVSARLHLSAHGVIVAHLNDHRVGEEVLAPGWTSYHRRLLARTHDVTDLLVDGENRLDATVAPGWFRGRVWEHRGLYGDHVGVLAQLEIETADGSRIVVASDSSEWSARRTAWTAADIYDGETFDARIGAAGPREPDCGVVEVEPQPTELVASTSPPVGIREVLWPVSVQRRPDGTVAVDVGQNISGWLRLRLCDVPRGCEVVVRHAEVLDHDGGLLTEPLRTAEATDRYVSSGSPEQTYEPCFTFHGFRFAEITGVPEGCALEVLAVAIAADLERTGTFECSDPRVDRLHSNVVWSWRDNSVSVPTDCPQRDERLGWTGDIQVFSPIACYLDDAQTFLENWLADLRADQADDGTVPAVVPEVPGTLEFVAGLAGWGDAAAIVPWSLYEAYGDEAVLEDNLGSMRAWVEHVHSLLDADGIWRHGFQFGDWLEPGAPHDKPWQAATSAELVATAYAARSTDLLARSAAVVGDADLARRMAGRLDDLRKGWWAAFCDEAARSQTGCAMALCFDLAPDSGARERIGDRLAELVRESDGHLATGFLGTALLLPALSDAGHDDLAGELLLQDTPPSWLYCVEAGATTIWERWDAMGPDGRVKLEDLSGIGASMVSFNHYAFGSVADWLHRYLLGISPVPEDPGYHTAVVAPRPCGGITSASGALLTRFGRLAVAWELSGGRFTLRLDVPPNSRARVRLPEAWAPEPEELVLGSGSWRIDDTGPRPTPLSGR